MDCAEGRLRPRRELKALKGLLFCSESSRKTIKNNPFLAGSARFVTVEAGPLDVVLDIPLVLMNSNVDCKLSITLTDISFTGISDQGVRYIRSFSLQLKLL